jgi:hypothetical protein
MTTETHPFVKVHTCKIISCACLELLAVSAYSLFHGSNYHSFHELRDELLSLTSN